MNSNIIEANDGRLIGFTDDIIKYVKSLIKIAIDDNDFEQAKELAELWGDINEAPHGMIVVSDNNGMGYTINEYKGE